MTKICCLNPISEMGTNNLTSDYELTQNLEEADAVLVRSADMHSLDFPESLTAIARAGAGVNNIPLDRCTENGILVFNTPGANANGVKELVLAGMLLAARDIDGGIRWVQENREDETISKDMEKSKKQFAGTELKGKTLGVIGLGAIGIEVANAADALGMHVIGYDPYLSVSGALRLSRQVRIVETPGAIYANCNYITLHVPLLDDTRGMINKEAISMMQDGTVILNYARDLLVNDDDIAEGLASGRIRRYMTDFPNPKTCHMTNVIATPHLGASTAESEDNCAVMAVDELRDFIETGRIRNSVNYPSCTLPPEKCACRICIMNVNRPNMIVSFSSLLSAEGINIPNMTNKSRGNAAYTLIDCDTLPDETVIEKIRAIDGVKKIRVIYYE
ncbi:MAG: 3-phosphoglycerate dehydrogenase family protein [Lachnospiraceae bacterium]|nr:3-phosphoglycerate dehydrogenase family protein [Lachnospiraceae bacterium]